MMPDVMTAGTIRGVTDEAMRDIRAMRYVIITFEARYCVKSVDAERCYHVDTPEAALNQDAARYARAYARCYATARYAARSAMRARERARRDDMRIVMMRARDDMLMSARYHY